MKAKTIEIDRRRASARKRSTIGLKVSTKQRLDEYRAPGQCYDGFIQQMVEHWEKSKASNRY